eukprot:scaffold14625_cov125-Isochrysis_galbana.AAC.2
MGMRGPPQSTKIGRKGKGNPACCSSSAFVRVGEWRAGTSDGGGPESILSRRFRAPRVTCAGGRLRWAPAWRSSLAAGAVRRRPLRRRRRGSRPPRRGGHGCSRRSQCGRGPVEGGVRGAGKASREAV